VATRGYDYQFGFSIRWGIAVALPSLSPRGGLSVPGRSW
jgi:hypothetical protein